MGHLVGGVCLDHCFSIFYFNIFQLLNNRYTYIHVGGSKFLVGLWSIYMYLSVCLYILSSVCPSFTLYVSPCLSLLPISVCLSLCLSLSILSTGNPLFIPSVYFVYPFVYPCLYLSVYPFVYTFIYPFIYSCLSIPLSGGQVL